MKNIIKIKVLVLAGILIFLSSCTNDFDEMNTNPNELRLFRQPMFWGRQC